MIRIETERKAVNPVGDRLKCKVARAVDEAADDVAAAARARVLANRKTGGGPSPLAGSVRVRPAPSGSGRTVEATAPHARFVELGTRRMAARPFLRPALMAVRADLVARIRTIFREGAA